MGGYAYRNKRTEQVVEYDEPNARLERLSDVWESVESTSDFDVDSATKKQLLLLLAELEVDVDEIEGSNQDGSASVEDLRNAYRAAVDAAS